MILAPAQWKTLQDCYALASYLESDPNMRSVAERLRDVVSEAMDLAQSLEPGTADAPF